MPLPEHQTPTSTGRRSQAPYNFVPLPEAVYHAGEVFERHDRLDPDRLHGRISVHLVTETELYTRCAYPPCEEDKSERNSEPRQDFYHHGDPLHPVIPGASLRGMVRALVEILSYSRISRRDDRSGRLLGLRDEALVYRAVADQITPTGKAYNNQFLGRRGARDFDYPSDRVRGGYLEPDPRSGGWRIRPARRIQGVSFVRVFLRDLERNGFQVRDGAGQTIANRVMPVWVRPEPVRPHPHRSGLTLRYARTDQVSRESRAGLVPGTLVYSGAMRSRHMHTVIYAPDPDAAPIPIDETLWEQFRDDRDQQRGIPCRKIGKPGDPLFYLSNGKGLEFIGPTLFFRLPYPNRTGDYLPAECIDSDGPLDLAEAIFGTVNGEARQGRPETEPQRGRVGFDDAVWHRSGADESSFLEGADGYRWPSILSAPKPTCYQHYLVQTEAEGDKDRLLSYAAPLPDRSSRSATALRGFKQYWHRGSAADEGDLRIRAPAEHIKQYTRIRPVRPGVQFRSTIRFENLLPVELGALLAALELPASCRHRLGMGKPLGMGSVRIDVQTTLIDPRARYRSLHASGRLAPPVAEQAIAGAREAFRAEIVAHHNRHVPSATLPETAELWDIPRLASFRTLLDWEHRPARVETAYLRDPRGQNLKEFRERRVLPTPAAVVGPAEPTAPRPGVRRHARQAQRDATDSIASTPALRALQALLRDETRSQRQRLDAIDDTLLGQLSSLDGPLQRQAWRMIASAIGSNRKTRERLKTIDQRLGGDAP